jgi:hypothetical protein
MVVFNLGMFLQKREWLECLKHGWLPPGNRLAMTAKTTAASVFTDVKYQTRSFVHSFILNCVGGKKQQYMYFKQCPVKIMCFINLIGNLGKLWSKPFYCLLFIPVKFVKIKGSTFFLSIVGKG